MTLTVPSDSKKDVFFQNVNLLFLYDFLYDLINFSCKCSITLFKKQFSKFHYNEIVR